MEKTEKYTAELSNGRTIKQEFNEFNGMVKSPVLLNKVDFDAWIDLYLKYGVSFCPSNYPCVAVLYIGGDNNVSFIYPNDFELKK